MHVNKLKMKPKHVFHHTWSSLNISTISSLFIAKCHNYLFFCFYYTCSLLQYLFFTLCLYYVYRVTVSGSIQSLSYWQKHEEVCKQYITEPINWKRVSFFYLLLFFSPKGKMYQSNIYPFI